MAITFNANPMTELEAVNMMLLSIGKAPVNTLPTSGAPNDVSWAQTTLFNTLRDVQARGWWFNRETCFPITLDGSGQAVIPASVVDIHPSDNTLPLNERNGMMYDVKNHTFDMRVGAWAKNGTTINFDLLWCFPFEQIPHVARSYVAMRSGRTFQVQAIASQVLYQFTKEMEVEAEALLQKAELKNSGTNMFNQPTRNGRIYNRQPGAPRNNGFM